MMSFAYVAGFVSIVPALRLGGGIRVLGLGVYCSLSPVHASASACLCRHAGVLFSGCE